MPCLSAVRIAVGQPEASNWIKQQIDRAPLVEGRDWVSDKNVANRAGGRPRLKYAITVDAAKHVAMLSGTEMACRIRDYFLEMECQAKAAADPILALSNPAAMRGLLLTYAEKQIELQGKIEEMRPQVQALERIALSDGSLCITDAAKTLQVQPKSLFSFLRSHGWVYTPHGGRGDIAYQAKLQSGLLEHKTTTVHRSDGSEKTVTQVRVTPKGLTRLAREFQPAVRAA